MRRDFNKSKRKRSQSSSEEDDEDVNDVIAAQLAAYGERFMSMFDDNNTRNKTRKVNVAEGQKKPPFEEDQDEQSNGFDTDKSSDDDDFDQIFNAKEPVNKIPKNKANNIASKLGKSSKTPGIAPLIDPKLERKRFMSHKADKILSGSSQPQLKRSGKSFKDREALDDAPLSREEFQKLQREVHRYGAAALDKKSKKQFDAAMLTAIGARQEKGNRIPAKIGIGMAKKRKKREDAALEEAIAAGMVQRKGLGKKKQAEKRANLDKGLMEDAGAFKDGVLKVKSGKRSGGQGKRW